MQNKNSKSESYIVKEAENVIQKYLENRERSNIKSYNKLKLKYERLRILTVVTIITFFIGMIFSIIF